MPKKRLKKSVAKFSKKKVSQAKKRDGRIVDFDKEKIREAVFKAVTATGQGDGRLSKKVADKVTDIINRRFNSGEIPGVEQIQDIVEEVLILENLIATARAYILYREQRRRTREAVAVSEEAVDRIDNYLEKIDWEVKENANMTFSLQGLNRYGTSYIVKKYWLNKIYPKEIRDAVKDNLFHLHNLDTLGAYCAGWDLYDLLVRGFGGAPGKVESKPAKHFRAALGQLVNFLYTVQGEVAGAVAVSNFDTLLAPFIRYDGLSYVQAKQALQEFLFNMAVSTRVGFQSPFSNITLDLRPSPVFAKQPVIVGGKPQKEVYAEFEEEMKIFDKALYEIMLEGDKAGRPFHFPIPTINVTKDFPWDEPAFNPIFEASAKYGTNYFANYINSEMKPEDTRSMCKPPSCQIIYENSKGEIAKTEIRRIVDDFLKRKNNIKVLINGELKPVKDVVKLKLVNKHLIRVTLANGVVDRMTPDHPSMIVSDGKLKQVESSNLKVGDVFPFSKRPYQGELGDYDLGRLIGLYLGDGWLSHKDATVNVVCNIRDKKLIDFVKSLVTDRFAAPTWISCNKEHNYSRIAVASRALAGLVREYIRGEKALTKRLQSKVFARHIDFRKGLLVGMIESDGFVHKKKNYIEIHLGNKALINDLLVLARTLGINGTYFESKNSTGSKNKKAYSLRFAGDLPKWMRDYFNLKQGRNLKYKEYKDFYGVEIVKIKKVKYSGYVYDFEVEGKEHLFQLANGIITHNCCRLRLDLRELQNRGGGGLFGAGALTGSLGVVTINLPRIAYLSKTKKEFFNRLEKAMDLAKESLELKRKVLESYIQKGLYPYSRHYLEGVKRNRGEYYANHFSTIGLVGMNEALLNFIDEDIGTPKGRRFAIEILEFMRKRLLKYQKETGNIYNLEQTPAESTAYRLAQKDRQQFPDIITAGTKEVPYYTNSTQLPVNYTDDPFTALKLQDEIQCKYTGGSVLHLFLGEKIREVDSAKALIKKVFENFHLPYTSLTPTFSICPVHGYLSGEHFECPKCTIKQPCEVYSRIVGYYRPVKQWNEGKQQEYKERKEFILAR